MSTDPDPLAAALRDATMAALLGSTEIPHQFVDPSGNVTWGTVRIESAFGGRINSLAHKGEFDGLINQAMSKVDADSLARAFEGMLAKRMLDSLEKSPGYQQGPTWFQSRMKDIAVDACKAALAEDDALLDTLRARIGAEVDRNRVGITVNLSDPETGSG